jgi:hypothetical protein
VAGGVWARERETDSETAGQRDSRTARQQDSETACGEALERRWRDWSWPGLGGVLRLQTASRLQPRQRGRDDQWHGIDKAVETRKRRGRCAIAGAVAGAVRELLLGRRQSGVARTTSSAGDHL